ncbi:MAG: putative exosortase interaction protein [Acidobacteria bacterium]|nr:putative exosortase interaction protein [Acidobacteriota bacterium]
MKRLKGVLNSLAIATVFVGLSGAASPASAASVIYTASTTGLTDLVHQNAYAWQLNGVNVGNNTITSAVLTFYNFANWTTAALDPNNILWVDLLDAARNVGTGVAGTQAISSMIDDTNTGTLHIADVLDGFRYSGGTNVSVVGAGGLVTTASQVTYLGSSRNTADAAITGYTVATGALGTNTNPLAASGAFGTVAQTWTLTITNSTVLTALGNYITNGKDIAIGLDADCHFSDTGIQFDIYGTPNVTQAAVPEPASLLLLGSGLVAAYRRRRKSQSAV